MTLLTTPCCSTRSARAPQFGARAVVLLLTSLAAATLLPICTANATPFTPNSDDAVLETLPYGVALRPKRPSAQAASDATLEQAREYVRAARQSGDSRYLGYARAALKPWRIASSVPLSILLLQAEIEQHEHNFATALLILDRVSRDQPRLAAVHQMRAAIYQVQGRYGEAERECRFLVLQTSALSAVDCVARTMSRTGHARRAYEMLSRLQLASNSPDPLELRDSHLTLAEIAVQMGDRSAARTHYEQALKLAEPDAYTLATYADFLLEQREFDSVIGLAQRYPENQDLKIRAALAAQSSHADRNPWAREVRDLIAGYRLRGDFKNTRDYARFLLDVEHNSTASLEAALENWRTQREPADAIIVMRAALSCSPRAATEVAAFIATNHLDDVRLQPLLNELASRGVRS